MPAPSALMTLVRDGLLLAGVRADGHMPAGQSSGLST